MDGWTWQNGSFQIGQYLNYYFSWGKKKLTRGKCEDISQSFQDDASLFPNRTTNHDQLYELLLFPMEPPFHDQLRFIIIHKPNQIHDQLRIVIIPNRNHRFTTNYELLLFPTEPQIHDQLRIPPLSWGFDYCQTDWYMIAQLLIALPQWLLSSEWRRQGLTDGNICFFPWC